jgi:hypothetical protein
VGLLPAGRREVRPLERRQVERHVAAISSVENEVTIEGFGTEFITVYPAEHPVFIQAVGKEFSRGNLLE